MPRSAPLQSLVQVSPPDERQRSFSKSYSHPCTTFKGRHQPGGSLDASKKPSKDLQARITQRSAFSQWMFSNDGDVNVNLVDIH
jgi:hypothetical protein